MWMDWGPLSSETIYGHAGPTRLGPVTTADNSPMPDDPRARLRAADADREFVHEILAAALSRGALLPAEYEERAGKAVAARTFGELDELTDDLPVADLGFSATPQTPAPVAAAHTRVVGGSGRQPVNWRVAVMGGSELAGNAAVGDQLNAVAIMGGVELDLREVEFTAPELTINCYAVMGGVEIVVPDDCELHIGGIGVMGAFTGKSQQGARPGAPRVKVTGLALMGGVDVKRKPPKGTG